MTEHWTDKLIAMDACPDAVDWARGYDSLDSAWSACERGDWMLWLAERFGADNKTLVLAACDCARLALPYTSDPRVLACIETTERWARGEATLEELSAARAAASAAAWAASDAARAAERAAAWATSDAARAAAWAAAPSKCADVARKHFPAPPEKKR